MIDVVAADARAGVPADAEEEAELYAAQVLNNPSFDKKGPYVKMCSWFSILAAVKYHDPSWTSLKHLMTFWGKNTASMTQGAEDRRAAAEQAISKSILGIDAASRALPAKAQLGPEDGLCHEGMDGQPEKRRRSKRWEKNTEK